MISVSDKTGVVDFARALHDEFGAEIISTGGTAKVIAEAGVPVTPIDEVTHFPEMMDGRVKTLHPMVHGGLLAKRDSPQHMAEAAEHERKDHHKQHAERIDDAAGAAHQKSGAARLLINILQPSNERGKAHRRRPHRRRDGNAQNADAAAVYIRNDDADELVHRVRQHGRDRREELFLGDGCIRKNRHAQNDDGHDGEKKPERR